MTERITPGIRLQLEGELEYARGLINPRGSSCVIPLTPERLIEVYEGYLQCMDAFASQMKVERHCLDVIRVLPRELQEARLESKLAKAKAQIAETELGLASQQWGHLKCQNCDGMNVSEHATLQLVCRHVVCDFCSKDGCPLCVNEQVVGVLTAEIKRLCDHNVTALPVSLSERRAPYSDRVWAVALHPDRMGCSYLGD